MPQSPSDHAGNVHDDNLPVTTTSLPMTVVVRDDGNEYEFTTEPIDSGEEPKEFGEEVVET